LLDGLGLLVGLELLVGLVGMGVLALGGLGLVEEMRNCLVSLLIQMKCFGKKQEGRLEGYQLNLDLHYSIDH